MRVNDLESSILNNQFKPDKITDLILKDIDYPLMDTDLYISSL